MFVGTLLLRVPHHPGMQLRGGHEPVQDLVVELADEVAEAEDGGLGPQPGHGLDEAVVVDAAHEVGDEATADVDVDTGEDELLEVQDTRTEHFTYVDMQSNSNGTFKLYGTDLQDSVIIYP